MVNTLGDLLKKSEDFLRRKGIEKPRAEAQILFAHALNLQRYQLITEDAKPLSESEMATLRELIKQKSLGAPTAYLTGTKNFFGRDFAVSQYTLIPRPETEELVSWILSYYSKEEALSILDLGTGTGCIGITLCLELANSQITLSDISEGALETARKNGEACLGNRVDYIVSNLYAGIPSGIKFSLIVSNPPYITAEEYSVLSASVKEHEPKTALLIPEPAFFENLFSGAKNYLSEGGNFFLETNPSLIESHTELLKKVGFSEVEMRRDYSDRQHFLRARL